MSDAPFPTHEIECDNCGKTAEVCKSSDLCSSCAEGRAFAQLAEIEPPEGGWPRGSDMDQI